MNKSFPNSSENGIQSIEEKIQEKIENIKKTYRMRFILLSIGFLIITLCSSQEKEPPKETHVKKMWRGATPDHQKIIIPVISFIDEEESQFPIFVDIYSHGKRAIISRAKLHSLQKNSDSLQEEAKAYIEVSKDQLSKIPKELNTLTFKLYPHLEVRQVAKGKSYEVIF